MSELKGYQQEIFENKINKGFNITNIEQEFLLLYGEVAEAFDAYKKNDQTNLAEELADVAIYLLGLSEILGIDLDEEIRQKIAINHKRQYRTTETGYAKKVE
ncbi:hypothetical protein DOK76_12850 [Vagococcus sp. DIV0080]|uniref:Pyrophosphatase n=1 Tax=Candidatus Vagococcus giribetii TaxID=2230876 RepID=A0ABS3HW16_9ENTE|nr:MazG-like family protein [Vagococcus sp. DIV0080]MBO0477955.1 hypothetical protein [Vagococcus sp. DIV0080]